MISIRRKKYVFYLLASSSLHHYNRGRLREVVIIIITVIMIKRISSILIITSIIISSSNKTSKRHQQYHCRLQNMMEGSRIPAICQLAPSSRQVAIEALLPLMSLLQLQLTNWNLKRKKYFWFACLLAVDQRPKLCSVFFPIIMLQGCCRQTNVSVLLSKGD